MITYELAKKLKDAGFPQNIEIGSYIFWEDTKELFQYDPINYNKPKYENYIKVPILSELIEACGNNFLYLERLREPEEEGSWWASYKTRNNKTSMPDIGIIGKTPEEAVANLWLELNNNGII